MNTLDIEDRIRAATRAAADTVTPDSVPPLRLPSDRPFRSRSSSFASVWGRWLAPVAAAAAIVVVAVVMVTVGRTAGDRPGATGPRPSIAVRPGPVKTGPSISSYVASGLVPRYYVSIESQGVPVSHPTYAVVRATATGTEVQTYTPAYGQTVQAVTAAADDRTFMLDIQPWDNPNSPGYDQNFEARTFRELRLNSSGSIVAVNTLSFSVPRGQLMTGFALSPDGGRLAIAVQPDNNKREPDLTEVKVITLATGATVTWTADGTIGTGPDDARSLSWSGDARTLAFTWAASGPGIHTGLWLLNLDSGGGSLLADSRKAVTLISQSSLSGTGLPTSATPAPAKQTLTAPTCQLDSIITPDGSKIICGASALTGTLTHRSGETEFIEYSAATGKVTRILGYWTFGKIGGLAVGVLWSNPSGSVLIGVIPDSGEGRVGVISGNEFTPLPVAAGSQAPEYAAW